MLTYTLVSALAGASLILAGPAPAPAPAITAAPIFNRQSEHALELECEAHLASMLARQPSPSQDLLDWVNPEDEQDQFGIEDEAVNWCYVVFGMPAQDPPPSLTSQWFSYQSAQASYASSVAPAVSSLKAKCNRDIAPAFDMLVATDIESCHTAVKAAHSVLSGVDTTTTASPSPSRTVVLAPSTTIGPREETSASEKDTESKEGSAQSTGTSAAVGARETGYVAVAAAAAVAAIAGGMVVV